MKVFKIEIKETLAQIVEIEANTVEEAIDRVHKKYKNEEIVLDWSNHIATQIDEYSE